MCLKLIRQPKRCFLALGILASRGIFTGVGEVVKSATILSMLLDLCTMCFLIKETATLVSKKESRQGQNSLEIILVQLGESTHIDMGSSIVG